MLGVRLHLLTLFSSRREVGGASRGKEQSQHDPEHRISRWAHALRCVFLGRLMALNSGLRDPGQRKAPRESEAFDQEDRNTEKVRGSV